MDGMICIQLAALSNQIIHRRCSNSQSINHIDQLKESLALCCGVTHDISVGKEKKSPAQNPLYTLPLTG